MVSGCVLAENLRTLRRRWKFRMVCQDGISNDAAGVAYGDRCKPSVRFPGGWARKFVLKRPSCPETSLFSELQKLGALDCHRFDSTPERLVREGFAHRSRRMTNIAPTVS